MPELLIRSAASGIQLAEDSGAATLSGHFAVFNEPALINSALEGRFVERIAVGSFTSTIANDRARMRVLFQHGQDPKIGKKPIGTIATLREDPIGAYYEVRLFDGLDPLFLDGLRAGVYGASFAFQVMRDNYNPRPARSSFNKDRLPERVILEARVAEFGPVTFGAYAGATAALGAPAAHTGGTSAS